MGELAMKRTARKGGLAFQPFTNNEVFLCGQIHQQQGGTVEIEDYGIAGIVVPWDKVQSALIRRESSNTLDISTERTTDNGD